MGKYSPSGDTPRGGGGLFREDSSLHAIGRYCFDAGAVALVGAVEETDLVAGFLAEHSGRRR